MAADEQVEVKPVSLGGPPPPAAGQKDATRTAARATMKADLVAELAELEARDAAAPADAAAADETATHPAAPAKKPAAKKEPPAKAAGADGETPPADAEGEEDDEDEEDDDQEEDGEEEAKPAAKPDRKTEHSLRLLKRQERRQREALEAERRQFHRERDEERRQLAAERQGIAEFNRLRERATYSLVDIARALGVPEDTFEAQAEAFFAASSKGQKDPRYAARAQERLSHLERDREVDSVRAKLKELEAKEAARENERIVGEWVDGVVARLSADGSDPDADVEPIAEDIEIPRVRKLLANAPTKFRAAYAEAAMRLLDQTGEVPDAEDVLEEAEASLEALEKARRRELRALGIEIPGAPAKGQAAPTPKSPTMNPAAKTTPAKPNGDNGHRPPLSRDDERRALQRDVERQLARGQLE